MVSMSDELQERNILKLILIVRFACATLDVGHPILVGQNSIWERSSDLETSQVRENRLLWWTAPMIGIY
jgi:hypothetical protein